MGPTEASQRVAGPAISDITVANLRAEIARRGMNRQEFGRHMGWSKNTTTAKLTGRSALSLNELDRAARVLDVELLTLVAPPAPRREAS